MTNFGARPLARHIPTPGGIQVTEEQAAQILKDEGKAVAQRMRAMERVGAVENSKARADAARHRQSEVASKLSEKWQGVEALALGMSAKQASWALRVLVRTKRAVRHPSLPAWKLAKRRGRV